MQAKIFSVLMAVLFFSGCANIDYSQIQRTNTAVANGVINNTIMNAGDTAECGTQAMLNNAVTRAVTRNNRFADYSNIGNYDRCLYYKQAQRQMQEQRAYQEELMRQQEARRNAPQCDYTMNQTNSNGKTSQSSSRTCKEHTYEKWR